MPTTAMYPYYDEWNYKPLKSVAFYQKSVAFYHLLEEVSVRLIRLAFTSKEGGINVLWMVSMVQEDRYVISLKCYSLALKRRTSQIYPATRKKLQEFILENTSLQYTEEDAPCCSAEVVFSGLCNASFALSDKEKFDAYLEHYSLPEEAKSASPRIVNGTIARVDSHPWIVSLYYKRDFLCGGSIYNKRTIITAAHCVIHDVDQKEGTFSVKVGDHKLRWKDEYEVKVRADHVIAHPRYTNELFGFDVAVIVLSEDLTLNESVRALPITIPQRWEEKRLIKKNNCFVYGWGYDENWQLTNVVNTAQARVRDHEYCKSIVEPSGIVFYKSQVCTTFFDQTTCNGDSGGPLVCYDENDDGFHIGLVEYGRIKCDWAFTVFTRMVSFKKWIMKYAG
ncbi:Mannan-binding lectin serine protease 1 [Mactra antiquata]